MSDYSRDRDSRSTFRDRSPGRRGYSRSPPPRDSSRHRSRSPRRSFGAPYRDDRQGGGDQDTRVYVGNLAYSVRWSDLKDHFRQAGEVVHADVLKNFEGRSKGCGIVEFANSADARRAVETLTNTDLLGRSIFVREDRVGSRGPPPPSYRGRGPPPGGPPGGGFRGPPRERGSQLFVGNLPFNVGWRELKDLFRDAGEVARADVKTLYNGRSKGNGIVAFETAADARVAIERFNGYNWMGRRIEVREDRFSDAPPRGFHPPPGSFPPRERRPPNAFTDGVTGNGEPGQIIFVGNLPWTTTNQDLLELFETVGQVERAEIQFEPYGRSSGNGVVKFDTQETAELAISKFSAYVYGNRPLNLSYAQYANIDGPSRDQPPPFANNAAPVAPTQAPAFSSGTVTDPMQSASSASAEFGDNHANNNMNDIELS